MIAKVGNWLLMKYKENKGEVKAILNSSGVTVPDTTAKSKTPQFEFPEMWYCSVRYWNSHGLT